MGTGKQGYLLANTLQTAGIACSIAVPVFTVYFGYRGSITERFVLPFLIGWILCIGSSCYLWGENEKTRAKIGFAIAALFGLAYFSMPVIVE